MDGFGFVQKSIMHRKDLSIEAKGIFCFLSTYADQNGFCYPSKKTICENLGISEERFTRHMKALIDAGLVTKAQKRQEGNRFAGNTYRLIREPFPQFPYTENPYTENPSTGNSGMNNTKELTVPEFNITMDDNIFVRVAAILNNGKRRVYSKGRLKVSAARYMLSDILRTLSPEQIIDAAQRYTEAAVERQKDPSWSDFQEYIRKQYGKGEKQ